MLTAKPGDRSLSSGTHDTSKLSSNFRGAHTTNKHSQKERGGGSERRTLKPKGKEALWGWEAWGEPRKPGNHFAERRAIHNTAARMWWRMLLVPELGRDRSRRISHSKFQGSQGYRKTLSLNKQKQKKQTEGLASLYRQCWLPTVVLNHSFPS